MSTKHVLIVDDAKDILFLLQLAVKQLGPEYKVSTAADGRAALEKIQQQSFDLVITDYMMPGMTGMELVQEVRRISPNTQVVLMTAYDSAALRDKVEDLQLSGYVGKPFSVPQILNTMRRVVNRPQNIAPPHPLESPEIKQTVYQQLKTLHNQTGAHYVLLLNAEGRPVQVAGQVDASKATRLAMFVAANFATAAELHQALNGQPSSFKSSYHEGSSYNIYAYDINGDYLLAVVFGTGGKPGTVWFYTRQSAEALAPVLAQLLAGPAPAAEEGTTVATEFDDLLGNGFS